MEITARIRDQVAACWIYYFEYLFLSLSFFFFAKGHFVRPQKLSPVHQFENMHMVPVNGIAAEIAT